MRERILIRDSRMCFVCGCNRDLCVHHIYPERRFPDFLLEPDNLITLCRRCHVFSKDSQHQGIGQLRLFLKLQKERPEQFGWLVEKLNEE